MRRCVFFLSSLLLVSGAMEAQQKSPPLPPGENKPPIAAPPGAPQTPVAVPVPVPVGPTRPNGKIQKSLVRITVTEVEPDYKAPGTQVD